MLIVRSYSSLYLKVCSEKQYNKLLLPFEEEGMFCFNMYQDRPDSKPSSSLSGIYIETVKIDQRVILHVR